MTSRDKLLDDAERYCKTRGISLARLGKLVVNDGKFFGRVQAGGTFTVDTLEKFDRYFADAMADGMKGDAGVLDCEARK